MNLRFVTSLLLIAPAFLPGQDKTALIYPGPIYTEIKQYLGLADSQVQSLQTVLDNRNQSMQAIYTQINQKYDGLNQMLNSDSGSAVQLGQFLIDIRNLQKQLPLIDGPFKTQALNVLTADQKAKLPKLAEALHLQTTAWEAGALLLIDYPGYFGPIAITATDGGKASASVGSMLPSAPPALEQRLQFLPAKR